MPVSPAMPTVEELRKVAEAATTGNWRVEYIPAGRGHARYIFSDRDWRLAHIETGSSIDAAANALHIATFNPTVVLALLERIERAEKALLPFANYVRGINPRADGMTIKVGMQSARDGTGWAMREPGSTDGIVVADLIAARAALEGK